MDNKPANLNSTFIRLRPDSTTESLPVGPDFWQKLVSDELGSFHNEYLVAVHAFSENWSSWEKHPLGEEIVCLLSGSATLALEKEGSTEKRELNSPGDFIVVPKDTWHTADIDTATTMLFITAGEGTENRDR